MKPSSLAALLLLPLLSACAPELETGVTIGELQHVARTGQPLVVSALLRLPQTSIARCEADLPLLVAVIQQHTAVGPAPRCMARSLDTFAELPVHLAVSAFDASPANTLSAITAEPAGDGSISVAYRLLLPYEDILFSATRDIRPRPDIDPTVFIVVLRNDIDTSIEFLPGGQVTIDGKTSQISRSLAPGETVELHLNPIAAALIQGGGHYTFAQIFTSR